MAVHMSSTLGNNIHDSGGANETNTMNTMTTSKKEGVFGHNTDTFSALMYAEMAS